MGFLDKIKDLFMDEIEEGEEIELEEEEKKVYEKPKDVLPKVMRDTIEEKESLDFTSKFDLRDDVSKNKSNSKEFNELYRDNTKETFTERKIEKVKKEVPHQVVVQQKEESKKKFSFPVDFQEDYVPKRSSNVNVLNSFEDKKNENKKVTSELYPKKNMEKPKFKASPVISPVYGILDKNYKKDEVKEREEAQHSMKRPSKIVDFETVRKKAFGNLSDDIKDNLLCENCELYKEVKRINSLKEDDLLYDLTQDPSNDKHVTLEKAYDNYEEFGVAYEHNINEKVEEIVDDEIIVDHSNEVEAEEIKFKEPDEDLTLKDNKDDLEKEEIEDVKIVSRTEKNKDNDVDSDFFDLIDSMYKERVDE